MREKDIFVVAERWTESRTPSGRWSKAKEDYYIQLFNREQFDMFLADRWEGERRSGYTYTRHGYFPSRVVVPKPFAPQRSVTEFTFSDERKFAELVRDSHEDESAVRITSPRLVANGAGAWSGTVEEYDADVLRYDNRFSRVVLERAAEGVFGGDESLLPGTLTEVAQALSRQELAEFCEDLFDDPNVTLG